MNPLKPFKLKLLIVILFFILQDAFAASRICFIFSEKNKVYDLIADTCEKELKNNFPDINIKTIFMETGKTYNKEILDFYPDVNFALGGAAAKLCDTFSVFPYLFTMVLNPEALGLTDTKGKARGFGTGITVILDPLAQFKALKSVIPESKVIGTLYSEKTSGIISKASESAESLGMKLVAQQVNSIDDVTKAFRLLVKSEIDTFWLLLDTNVLSMDTIEYYVQGCNIRQINLLTFNPNHLKNGASIAVFIDYLGLGKQSAEIISRILKGQAADKIPVEGAKYTTIKLHEKNVFHKK